MKELILSNHSRPALVDDNDYDRCVEFSDWCRVKISKTEYAISTKGGSISLHRFVLNLYLVSRPKIDHRNLDGLDCRKFNLRPCTYSQNNSNRRIPKSNTSGYKGVRWDSVRNKWKTTIQFKGKKYHLGYFTDKILAIIAYDDKAIELFGQFASINFPLYGA